MSGLTLEEQKAAIDYNKEANIETAVVGTGLGMLGGAVNGVVGGIYNQYENKLNAERSYKYGEMAADNAQQRSKDYFDYTLDKTNPKAQVQMLEDAGLSVGLMYGGKGSTSGGSTGGMAQGGGAGSQQGSQISSSMMVAQQMQKTQAEIEVLKSQAKKNNSDAGLTGAKTTEQEIRNTIADATKSTEIAKAGEELQGLINNNKISENNALIMAKEALIKQEELTRSQLDTKFEQYRYNNRTEISDEELKQARNITRKTKWEERLQKEQYLANDYIEDMKEWTYWSDFGFKLLDRGLDIAETVLMFKRFGAPKQIVETFEERTYKGNKSSTRTTTTTGGGDMVIAN